MKILLPAKIRRAHSRAVVTERKLDQERGGPPFEVLYVKGTTGQRLSRAPHTRGDWQSGGPELTEFSSKFAVNFTGISPHTAVHFLGRARLLADYARQRFSFLDY